MDNHNSFYEAKNNRKNVLFVLGIILIVALVVYFTLFPKTNNVLKKLDSSKSQISKLKLKPKPKYNCDVNLFTNPRFQGDSETLIFGDHDTVSYDDAYSSMQVLGDIGCKAIVYEQTGFKGSHKTLPRGFYKDLGSHNFSDKISSIKVDFDENESSDDCKVSFFKKKNFQALINKSYTSDINQLKNSNNDSASSAIVEGKDCSVTMFDGLDFTGSSKIINEGAYGELSDFDNKLSSFKIE